MSFNLAYIFCCIKAFKTILYSSGSEEILKVYVYISQYQFGVNSVRKLAFIMDEL